MKNILLTGLPGSGKSFFGKALAEKFAMKFVDLDQLIVQRQGMTIDEIFRDKGEEAFRDAETSALKTIEGAENTIVATGGGIILKEENRKLLDQLGITIFLERDPDNILGDVSLLDRPLLKDNPQRLKELHKERLSLYLECADFIVDSNKSREEVIKQLGDIAGLDEKKLRLAVIGDPIAHSLSPEIHKNILGPFVKEIHYEKIRIEKGNLGKAFAEGLANLDGFNVTMPHKTDVIEFIDRLDPKAKEMNSVNTVAINNGAIHGYSTDGDGIRMAIENMGKSFEGARVMILGSGGAASVAAFEAARHFAAEIKIFSRKAETGAGLPAWAELSGLHFSSYQDLLAGENQADILINASPIGMEGVEDILGDYSFLDGMKGKGAVLNMVYHPPRTKLFLEAEKRSIPAKNGLDMLIGQAISADNIFLSVEDGAKLGIKKAYKRASRTLNREDNK